MSRDAANAASPDAPSAGGFTALLWAMKQATGVSSTTKLVLICLAGYADPAGRCHPSLGRLGEDTRLSERACRTALRSLQAADLIQVKLGAGPHGTSVYHLRLDASKGSKGAERASGGRNVVPPEPSAGGRNVVPKRGARRAPELPIELPIAATRAKQRPKSTTPRPRKTQPMPLLNDPKEAWHHLADRLPNGNPDLSPADYSPEVKEWAARVGNTLDPIPREEVGQARVAGDIVAYVARAVCYEAGMSGRAVRLDWTPMLAWLRDGLDVQKQVLPAIRRVAARQGYQPPRTLKYFDQAVREFRP